MRGCTKSNKETLKIKREKNTSMIKWLQRTHPEQKIENYNTKKTKKNMEGPEIFSLY